MNILIVGATGNLGSLLTRDLFSSEHHLRLFTHKRNLPFDLTAVAKAEIFRGDQGEPASLVKACANIDCIVYLARVLFQPRPEKFLQRTNTAYVKNIVDAAVAASVKKFILISFPHIEENTSPDHPAKGVLDAEPKSIHARTQLAAEKYLLHACATERMTPIVLRAGVIYGSGVKLIEAARWLMRRRLMANWQKPTWIHLLALPDFLRIIGIAIDRDNLSGIYNLCDDQPLLLQDFLDVLAVHWNSHKPWRLPPWCFYAAAVFCEAFATIFHISTPLTRDIVRMGMTSVVADTSRVKREITSRWIYPTLTEGLPIL